MNQTTEQCVSCGADLQGKFCSACGEKTVSSKDFTLSHILEQGVDVFTHLDSKFYKSARDLLLKPGLLAVHYINGVRKPYMKPFQVFFLCNILFFFFLSSYDFFFIPSRWFFNMREMGSDISQQVNAIAAAKNMSRESLAQIYDQKVVSYSKLCILLLVPVIAVFSLPFGGKKLNQYGKHLIFALFFLSFLMIALVVYAKLMIWLPWDISPLWFNLPFFSGMLIYTKFAMDRFLDRGQLLSWLAALTLIAGFILTVLQYRWSISWLTLHSI